MRTFENRRLKRTERPLPIVTEYVAIEEIITLVPDAAVVLDHATTDQL